MEIAELVIAVEDRNAADDGHHNHIGRILLLETKQKKVVRILDNSDARIQEDYLFV